MSTLFSTELVKIQGVSSSGNTFILLKGAKEGVYVGQSAVFTDDHFAITAQVIEVSRFESLWQSKNDTVIPFANEAIIRMNDPNDPILALIYNDRARQEELFAKKFGTGRFKNNTVEAKVGIGTNLVSTISDVADNQEKDHYEFSIEIDYNYLLFKYGHSGAIDIGFFAERDTKNNQEPFISIATVSYIFKLGYAYHFKQLDNSQDNYYLGTGIGVGLIRSQILGTTYSGVTLVSPYVKVGRLFSYTTDKSMLLEFILESKYSSLKFPDDLTQSSMAHNLRIALGIKF